jgi:hypothetical protein
LDEPIPQGKTFAPGTLPTPLVYVVTPGFFRAMGIQLAGLDFTWADNSQGLDHDHLLGHDPVDSSGSSNVRILACAKSFTRGSIGCSSYAIRPASLRSFGDDTDALSAIRRLRRGLASGGRLEA